MKIYPMSVSDDVRIMVNENSMKSKSNEKNVQEFDVLVSPVRKVDEV